MNSTLMLQAVFIFGLMLRHLILIMICSCSLPAYAQFNRDFSFKNFSVVNGLAANSVRDVVQDAHGFIWIATDNGLQRYDGSGFITINEAVAGHREVEKIVKLALDKENRLWTISQNNKVGIVSTQRFTYTPVYQADPVGQLDFWKAAGNKLMLIHRVSGIFRLDVAKKTFVRDTSTVKIPGGWRVRGVCWDPVAEGYWSTCDSGLVLYKPGADKIAYRGHNEALHPAVSGFAHLRDLFDPVAHKGNLVFNRWGPGQGVARFYRYANTAVLDSFEFHKEFGYHELKGMLVQRNSRFWLYGMPFLAEWGWQQRRLNIIPNEYRNEQSIRYDEIRSAYEDREQNIWLATDNGLFYFNPDDQLFDSYKLFRPGQAATTESPVHVIRELDDGRIIVGTWGNGLFAYDKHFKPTALPASLKKFNLAYGIWDMAIHPKTRELWITLQGGGIIVYNQKTGASREFYPEVFERATIRQVDEDTSGNLWFGTQRGHVVKWDQKAAGGDPTRGYTLVAKTGRVMKVHYDYSGYMYVGTDGHGLLKFDANTGALVKRFSTHCHPGERLFDNLVSDMTYYNDSTLIIAAGCLNILNTRTGRIQFFSKEHGLPFNSVISVERDRSDIIWAGMTNGICRINLKKGVLTYYDRRDGIPHDKFSEAGVKELSDGRIVFFTDHNFMVLNPAHFVSAAKPSKPVLTTFNLGSQLLQVDSLLRKKMVVLPYHKNSIAIGFSTLSFLPQRKQHFYYRLEPVEKEWQQTDKPLRALYNYLPPGDYVFRVRTSTPDGQQSDEELSLNISVRPPFWKSWWFLSVTALLVILVFYLLDRERLNKMRSMQLLRRQIRRNLREEISITLNSISVLSQMARKKAQDNPEQAKAFIGQISDKSRGMMEVLDDTLWSIDPQNDSMQQTLLRISETTHQFMSQYNVAIDLMVDKKAQSLQLDMKRRHDFFFFYKEAMLYVVKELEARQVFVNINQVRSRLLLEILTEIPGCPADADISFEISLARRMAEMPATLDTLLEGSSFSAVLGLHLK